MTVDDKKWVDWLVRLQSLAQAGQVHLGQADEQVRQ